jgi:thioredoxin reductase
MTPSTDVAIIGAGPYGLSIAAHLHARSVDHRIIGKPMIHWLEHMPNGMLLKSEGFSSNLYDQGGHFTLERYCSDHGIAYADLGLPVRLDTFSAYGLAFQKKVVPQVEDEQLVALSRQQSEFLLRLSSGASFTARRVLLATGIDHFHYIPAELAHLPRDILTHSSEHRDLHQFKGRDVVVIGGGASAIDLAALLHESGATVRLVARRPLAIHGKMRLPRPLWQRVRHPMSTIGPSWRSRFFTDAPGLFRYLPPARRLRIVKTFLGPAAGWFMQHRIEGVPLMLGYNCHKAERTDGRVRLQLVAGDHTSRHLVTEHVIAATGHRVDLRRLPFLSDEIRLQLNSVEHTPVLSSHFQSSVPGLYFVGPAAANSFGPVMRFVAGAKFTAHRISRHLAAS